MKIDFNQEIKTIDGKPIPKQGLPFSQQEIEKDKQKPKENLKLIDVAINALLSVDEKSTGDEKFKRYTLAMQIHSNSNGTDLKTEEIAMMKELIGKMYSPLVVGQAWQMLEREITESDDKS